MPRSVVEFSVDRGRRRNEQRMQDSGALVFLDADRLERDRAAGRDPETVPGHGDLRPVYLRPKLEGLLLRLHPSREAHFPVAEDAETRLRALWPSYQKPMPAAALQDRFVLDDLRRAAAYDPDRREALRLLGLLP